jgi:hypothetical protein
MFGQLGNAQEDTPANLDPASAPAPRHVTVVHGSENPNAAPIDVATVLMLHTMFGRENSRRLPAANRFAERYGTDTVVATTMVAAIRQVVEEMHEDTLTQRQAFCARKFSDERSWKAAVIAADAETRSAQVAAFNKLRDIAGPDLWEKIVLQGHEAARSMTIVQDDHDSAVAELGYEKVFANQCRNQ